MFRLKIKLSTIEKELEMAEELMDIYKKTDIIKLLMVSCVLTTAIIGNTKKEILYTFDVVVISALVFMCLKTLDVIVSSRQEQKQKINILSEEKELYVKKLKELEKENEM